MLLLRVAAYDLHPVYDLASAWAWVASAGLWVSGTFPQVCMVGSGGHECSVGRRGCLAAVKRLGCRLSGEAGIR